MRPTGYCLCAHLSSISNRTRLLVLQHPDEAKHPLNTARLAVLGLKHADLWVGESFPQLSERIASAKQTLLLFPADSHDQHPHPHPHQHQDMRRTGDSVLLIVPDGTWRKARKIIYANPVLGTLPRFSLPPGEPSNYRVRKAREPAAVATIEAIARALSILEPEQNFQPLLKPFGVLVEQQIQAMGEDVYRRNYVRS